MPWGMKGEVLLRFVRRHAPPGKNEPYVGTVWCADNWFPNLPAALEMERMKRFFTFTWVKNAGAKTCDAAASILWLAVSSQKGFDLHLAVLLAWW